MHGRLEIRSGIRFRGLGCVGVLGFLGLSQGLEDLSCEL